MKQLIFCSASFHISSQPVIQRENEYLHCIIQLLRVIPKNYDVVICDNTISKITDIQLIELRNILCQSNIMFLILNRNIGVQNIGMGELDELIFTSQNIDFKLYDKIVYFTLRKFVTNPWIFEKVNNLQKKILVSNPPFLALNIYNNVKDTYNFSYSDPTINLYNDMFFAMSSDLMLKYIEYSINQMIINIKNKIGSEQNLYNFINNNKYEYEWLEYLGLIRIDYKANNEIQLI
jgi:hypothetical protein